MSNCASVSIFVQVCKIIVTSYVMTVKDRSNDRLLNCHRYHGHWVSFKLRRISAESLHVAYLFISICKDFFRHINSTKLMHQASKLRMKVGQLFFFFFFFFLGGGGGGRYFMIAYYWSFYFDRNRMNNYVYIRYKAKNRDLYSQCVSWLRVQR